MMITDEDRQRLTASVGKGGAFLQTVLFCGIFFQLLVAAIKLYLAGLWIEYAGYSIHRFLVLYFAGVSVDVTYPGSLIRAGDDVDFGVLCLGFALLLSAVWWRHRISRQRTQRIINSLKSTGAW
jgi:hypothetical protein